MADSKTRVEKARCWTAVLWPENMQPDWQETIAHTVQVPCCYCIHDKDTDTAGEQRKPHVHVMMAWGNTTTRNHVLDVLRLLDNPDGEGTCVNTCEAVINPRHVYEYLIHNTKDARKAGKHLYDPAERVELNEFDIGLLEQVSAGELRDMALELCDFIMEHGAILDFGEFHVAAREEYGGDAWPAIVAYHSLLSRYVDANYRRWRREMDCLKEGLDPGSQAAEPPEGGSKMSQSRADSVKSWRAANPDGSIRKCASELGFSRNTVRKYWD